MGPRKLREYEDELWGQENNFWRLYFNNNQDFFIRQLSIEIEKIMYPDRQKVEQPEAAVFDMRDIEELSLFEIKEKDEKVWRNIRDKVYNKAQDDDGNYVCARTGYKNKSPLYFQIDHIVPLSKGGKTCLDHLQLLAR
ncbi:MAG: HNH endonuclease [bacterium]